MNAPKAIVGLGNPGPKFQTTRHNIGFLVLDALAEVYGGFFSHSGNFEMATIRINDNPVLLIKPQTFMNDSGAVIPALQKKGIKKEDILVIHDELEKPEGHVSLKLGGSAKGHNGLRSIIQFIGQDFARLRCGIGRPEKKEMVSRYVLSNFENIPTLEAMISDAVHEIEKLYK